MYLCPEIKVVFLAQPRTASRSCVHFLQARTPMRRHKQSAGHHSIDIGDLKGYRREGYRVVTAVRNHYDLIVSFYHHAPHWFSRPKGEETFTNYVYDFATHEKNQYAEPHALYGKLQPYASHIIRYENLWDEFSAATGLEVTAEDRQAFHMGKSDRKPYREYYDEDTHRFIAGWYKHEMEEYGYSF